VVVAFGMLTCLAVTSIATYLPRMYPTGTSGNTPALPDAPLENLRIWHWISSSISLVFLILAAALVTRRIAVPLFRNCLLVGFILMTGAALHRAVWPAGTGYAVTASNLLIMAGLLVITAGGFIGLRRFATERAHHLAAVRTRANELGIVVAHELGSPIAAIRGLVDILGLPDIDPADRNRALASIRGETAVLSVLAEDIQTLGAVEHQLLPVAPISVNIGLLIGDAVGFARILPGDHPISWPQTLTGRVFADPERIAQVFRNLLTNAAKYSPPGTPIEIRASRHHHRLCVAIVDRGPGVAPADTDRIFEKFDRGHRLLPGIPGTGIGLYVARALVRAHGSDITVEPTPGGGATFAFELEVAR
jgi:signal transduction histidine kinase